MISPLIQSNRRKINKNTRLESGLFDQEAIVMSANKKNAMDGEG